MQVQLLTVIILLPIGLDQKFNAQLLPQNDK